MNEMRFEKAINLDQWRQRGEDILVRGNDLHRRTEMGIYMPHKWKVNRHLWQEMEV